VFTYDPKKDAVIGALSLGMLITPYFLNNEPETVPAGLDRNDINAFDRSMMFSYNKPLDYASDYYICGLAVALPFLSLAGNITNKEACLTYGIMYAESLCLTIGTVQLFKNTITRYRPYMYSGGIPNGKENDYFRSFPSSSTSLAFMSAGFLSATFSAEYPGSRWKIPVIVGAYTLAATVSAGRVFSGAHFLSDVISGAVIGSAYGYLIPVLHRKERKENNGTFSFSGSGIIISQKF
jgi:membrane-associated phospholipid phosphatase